MGIRKMSSNPKPVIAVGASILVLVWLGSLALSTASGLHLPFEYHAAPGLYGREPAGFFGGVLHGITLPLNFILSLFGKGGIYEVYHTGWYNSGYCSGVWLLHRFFKN